MKIQQFFEKKIIFKINWGYFLAIFSFWVYGYHGAISEGGLPFQFFFIVFLTCSFGLVIACSLYLKEKFISCQTVILKDIAIVFAILCIFFLIASEKFAQPLVGDQLFYTYWSKIHEVLFLLKINEFSNLFFDDYKSVTIIHLFSMTLCAFVGVFFFVINKYNFSKLLIILIFCFLFVFLRILVIAMGGGGNPHPPGQLLPIWVTTSLFGLNNFTARIAQFLGFIIIISTLYFLFIRQMPRWQAAISSIALCSIPLLLHTSTIVEGSIWSTLAGTALILFVISYNKKNENLWVVMFPLLAAISLQRVPAFVALVFLFSFFLLTRIVNKEKNYNPVLIGLLSILVATPFIVKSIVIGTPASFIPGEVSFLPQNISLVNRLVYAFENNIIIQTTLSCVSLYWFAFLLGYGLMEDEAKWKVIKLIFIFLFFITLVAAFFSIRPPLWSEDKYKSEYAIPLIIGGGYLLIIALNKIKFIKAFAPFVYLLVFILGVKQFNDYPTSIKDHSLDTYFQRKSEKIYNYNAAIEYVKNEGYSENFVIVGVTYFPIHQIIQGFSVKSLRSVLTLDKLPIKNEDWTSASPDLIDFHKEIELVLISDAAIGSEKGGESLKNALLGLGWKFEKEFRNKKYNSVIYAIKRD